MQGDPFDILDAERDRIDRFYSGLSGDEWSASTRCLGWDRTDLLAHLIGVQEYTEACLDNTLGEYVGQGDGTGYEQLNEVLVRRRRGQDPAELLREWRIKVSDNHARLRQLGVEGIMTTSVGAYPVGRQAFYLACELAIHADDAGVPVSDDERAARLRWRADFGLDALAESVPDVTAARDGDRYTLSYAGERITLPEADFVEATSGRLPEGAALHEPLRGALVVLA